MDRCKDKPTGLVKPTVDEIVELCLRENLAYERRVMPQNCGIHPANRAGTGVDPSNAQNLAKKISMQGFSYTKLENPMGFEKGMGRIRGIQEAFMHKNYAESNGYLKQIPAHDADYLPVTCSHTFAAVNLANGGTPGLHPELCDAKGNIDSSKVLQLCPSWAKPMNEGIE